MCKNKYKILPPFKITGRLCVGIDLGDATLSLVKLFNRPMERDLIERTGAGFALDFPPDGTGQPIPPYEDEGLSSGAFGFPGIVCVFEAFLAFLLSAVESYEYGIRNRCEGENTTLFPLYVVEWAADNKDAIECALMDMYTDNKDGVECVCNESLVKEL